MSLAKKLLIKPNMRVGVMNAPEGALELIGELPAGVTVVADPADASLDLVVLFVKGLDELGALAPQAIAKIRYDALFWIAYPKKTSKIKTDINRDTGWAKMRTLGQEGVAMVAMDETWSAMRYRPAERVGK